MKVIFRTDGGKKIGLGHLMRCYALAEILQNDFSIIFVLKETPEVNASSMKGFETLKIVSEEDWYHIIEPGDIAVLDGYQFNFDQQVQIRKLGAKLVCIDDLHDKPFDADLIINHAPGIKKSDYEAKEYTDFALGIGYALLRPEFLSAAKEKRKNRNKITNGIVCFGGADLKSFTVKVADALLHRTRISVTVIAPNNEDVLIALKTLKQQFSSRLKIMQNIGADEMCAEMRIADFGVFPASTVLLEGLCTHLPVFSGYLEGNQWLLYKGLKEMNAFYDLEDFSDGMIGNLVQTINRLENIGATSISKKILFNDVRNNLVEKFRALC